MCDAEGCDPPVVVELQLYRHVYRRRHTPTRSGRSVLLTSTDRLRWPVGREQEWRVQDSSASGPQAARYSGSNPQLLCVN